MDPRECAEILEWHPELILLSEAPVTLEGMLTVPTGSTKKTRSRIKLVLPSYPQLNDAKLYFGRKLTSLYNKNFNEKILNLVRNAASVSSFLRQLQMLMGDMFDDGSVTGVTDVIETTGQGVLKELESVLQTSCVVRLSPDNGLDIVELILNNVSLKLQRDLSCTNAWQIVSTDLPQWPEFEIVEGTTFTLRSAANKLELQVKKLDDAWQQLKEIDKCCWVVDPLQPKPHHLYRRIGLSSSLSALVSIDPRLPTALPEIRLLGTDAEVREYEAIISKNSGEWNLESSLPDNLMMLLGLYEFPQPPPTEEVNEENAGIVGDEECCICFSLHLDEGEMPERNCNNKKCGRRFHTSCLLQWLQAIAGNEIVFGQLHGACPNCGENLSCPVTLH